MINAWTKTEQLWRDSVPQRVGAIREWTKFFGWEGEELRVDVPDLLVGGLEQVFLGAPFLCVVDT
jgi:hypothetical protein